VISTEVAAQSAPSVRKPSCGGAIQHHHVIILGDIAERGGDATEKRLPLPFYQGLGGVVLVFHQFEIAGNEVEPIEIGLAHDIRQRPSLFVVANGTVERFVRADYRIPAGSHAAP